MMCFETLDSTRCLLPERKGWYSLEVHGLDDCSWAEVWFDLGHGFVRYHSAPLGRIQDGTAASYIRLHRPIKSIAIRSDRSTRQGGRTTARLRPTRGIAIWLVVKRGASAAVRGEWGRVTAASQLSGFHAFPVSRRRATTVTSARAGVGPDLVTGLIIALAPASAGTARIAQPGGSNTPTCIVVPSTPKLSSDPTDRLSELPGCSHAQGAAIPDLEGASSKANWVLLLGPNAQLAPRGLAHLVRALEDMPKAVAVYGDGAGIEGLRGAFCLHRLLAGDTLADALLIRGSTWREHRIAQWIAQVPNLDGIALELASSVQATSIVHIAKTVTLKPTKASPQQGQVLLAARKRAARSWNLPAAAYRLAKTGSPPREADVTVVIPTRDRLDLLIVAVNSILSSNTLPRKILVVDNRSINSETIQWLADMSDSDSRFAYLKDDSEFNYARLNNLAAQYCESRVVAFMNNDVVLKSPDLLAVCYDMAVAPGTGAVGPLLLYPDGRIQHAGIVLGPGGVGGHALAGQKLGKEGPYLPMLTRTVAALTGACLFVEKAKFSAVGGFDENLAVAFNDVDLCLRLSLRNLANVIVPSQIAVHHESETRETDGHYDINRRLRAEFDYMRNRWGDGLDWDPWISPALRLDKGRLVPFWDRNPIGKGQLC